MRSRMRLAVAVAGLTLVAACGDTQMTPPTAPTVPTPTALAQTSAYHEGHLSGTYVVTPGSTPRAGRPR